MLTLHTANKLTEFSFISEKTEITFKLHICQNILKVPKEKTSVYVKICGKIFGPFRKFPVETAAATKGTAAMTPIKY